jgi:hypothetical protein
LHDFCIACQEINLQGVVPLVFRLAGAVHKIRIVFFQERRNDMLDLRINKLKVIGLLIVFMAFSGLGYADEVTDSINDALKYYQDGEYTDAIEDLSYALQLIKQKKAKELEAFLPKPLGGWTAQQSSSQAAGTAMFGGGITAERKYSRGPSSMTVQIITNSPMMQGVMMMLSNPMFAASDGGRLEKIGRQKAIVKFDPTHKQGEIKMVVANRFFVLIKGHGITEEDLKGYAKAIDYKKLASLP